MEYKREQLGADYESVRGSTGKYMSLTGQPGKGRKIQGGQSVAELDIRALLTFDVPNILKETLTLKSDDFNSKRETVMNIVENGQSPMPLNVGVGSKTNQLFYVMMTGMGLYITKK